MPGTTAEGIQFPVIGDKMAPLASWFATLASTADQAIARLRTEVAVAPLPAVLSGTGGDVVNLTATAWADLPSFPALKLTLSKPAWVQITHSAWMASNGGSESRASSRVTGATTLGESQVEVGGTASAWGVALLASGTMGQQSATRLVRLNAGENTVSMRAYGSGSGVRQVNYAALQVAPIRWA